MSQIGVATYKFDSDETLPHDFDVIEVKNSNDTWIEAQFHVTPDGWELIFDAEDICPMSEVKEFFTEWRQQLIKPMTKDVVIL